MNALLEKLKRMDWVLTGCILALVVMGTVFIWSAGSARQGVFQSIWITHAVTAAFGLALYFAFALVDYRRLLDVFATPAYVGALVLLVAVLLFGAEIYGGRRWLWFFQPSEISKLAVILFVAHLFGRSGRESFKWFLAGALVLGVPALLILKEPDLGTALVLVPAGTAMLLAARVWTKGLVALLLVGLLAAGTVLGTVFIAEQTPDPARRAQIYAYLPLRAHQLKRLRVFLFPEEDLRGAGWNLRQAKLSIGSGGYAGKGIGKGELNHLKYLPPSISMNDFIFCVYAEETGFVGSVVLLALFGLLLVSGCRVAAVAADARGRLLALGFSTLVFAHVYVNIAMSIGLVPITGLPLPFISSGRTFLLTVMCGLGLIQSVSVHRE